MTAFILDTNSLLRFLLNDIPKQADKVEDLVLKARNGEFEISIPQIVIFEISFTLGKYYLSPKSEIINKLVTILGANEFIIQDREVFNTAVEIFKSKNLDFVDCFLIAYTKLHGAKLFTFDRKLSKET